MRLLVVEDEKYLNKTLTERLTKTGYCVDHCFDGEEALYFIEQTEYDAILLDVMIPKINGYDVLKKIRQKNIFTPVLILTARDLDEDVIHGLDLGANDYLTKPFSFGVLCARIRAITRTKEQKCGNCIEIADLTIDLEKRKVTRGEKTIDLSSKEYAILEYMARNKGIVLSKSKIEKNIWNYDYQGGSEVVKVYIHHLRKKIDDDFEKKLFHTIKNVGYVLKEE